MVGGRPGNRLAVRGGVARMSPLRSGGVAGGITLFSSRGRQAAVVSGNILLLIGGALSSVSLEDNGLVSFAMQEVAIVPGKDKDFRTGLES